MIDCVLKDKMTTDTQKLGVIYEKQGEEIIVANFREIGKAWKRSPFELSRAGLLNQVCNGQFDKDKGYEFYIERDIMKDLRLDYVAGKGKGDIAKMVTRRKAELVKNMSYRSNKTHSLKLRKIRTKKQVEDEGQRKPRMKAAFQVAQFNGEGRGTPRMLRIILLHLASLLKLKARTTQS